MLYVFEFLHQQKNDLKLTFFSIPFLILQLAKNQKRE